MLTKLANYFLFFPREAFRTYGNLRLRGLNSMRTLGTNGQRNRLINQTFLKEIFLGILSQILFLTSFIRDSACSMTFNIERVLTYPSVLRLGRPILLGLRTSWVDHVTQFVQCSSINLNTVNPYAYDESICKISFVIFVWVFLAYTFIL